MQIRISFSPEEKQKLFLAFQDDKQKYKRIKDLIIGQGAEDSFKQAKKSRIVFMIAITIITIAGSMYPIFLKDYQSVLALWAVWGVLAVITLVWSIVTWNTAHKVLLENQAFFERFEEIAKHAVNLEHFSTIWETGVPGRDG